MRRIGTTCVLAVLAVGLFMLAPASAGEQATDQDEIQDLKARLDKLESRQATLLEQSVENYLEDASPWEGAQGDDALKGVSIRSRFTAIMQATVGLDPANRTAVSGDVDLDFDFKLTDNLDLFIYLTANTGDYDSQVLGASGGDSFLTQFAPLNSTGFPSLWQSGTTPQGSSFGRIAGTTFSGWTDGIGVNGAEPVSPGSITVYEAGIHHQISVGERMLHWEIGSLDPRRRFLQNRFADDENTQFINNLFDDSPSVLWLTDASGRVSLGLHLWMQFGGNNQWTVNTGWFNTPGQWFNKGQFYLQLAWKGEVNGQEMNVYLMGFVDEFFEDINGDGSAGGGASWDWKVNEKIGLFLRIATNGDDINPVKLDGSFGAAFFGLIGSRPDDVLGVAVGIIKANTNSPQGAGLPEDTEITVELYYKYVTEEGKAQITPHLMVVTDPGGNGSGWQDDALYILGLRIHVPF